MRIFRIANLKFMIAGKTLSDYTNLFSTSDYENNVKITYKLFNTNMVKENVSLKHYTKNS